MGYITVLPGAFSAYRYEAIAARRGHGPLAKYFKSLITPIYELGLILLLNFNFSQIFHSPTT